MSDDALSFVLRTPSDLGSATSVSLLLRAQRRESHAWRRLVQLYTPLVVSWCRRSGVKRDDVEDLVQEVFATVALRLGSFSRSDGDGSFRRWLRTITFHKFGDHIRRSRNTPPAQGGLDSSAVFDRLSWAEAGDADEECAVFQQALALLEAEFPATTWKAFWRVCVDECDPGAVAVELKISRNAIYLAKSRVLRRLREEFADLT